MPDNDAVPDNPTELDNGTAAEHTDERVAQAVSSRRTSPPEVPRAPADPSDPPVDPEQPLNPA